MLGFIRAISAVVIRVFKCGSCQHVFMSQFIEVICPKCRSSAVNEVKTL
jgi:Zn finger protein HypA/HybF involved in hydrogenase expression